MEKRLNTVTDTYYNLELIIVELEKTLHSDAIQYLRGHLYGRLEKMQDPQIMQSLDTITLFEKVEHTEDKSTTRYINYVKDANNGWRVQTGERFSEVKNLLTHVEDENITYYVSKDGLLAADVSTFHTVEHCFKERESVLTTTFVFENGDWDERFTRRNSYFQDTIVQHVEKSRRKIRV